MTVKQEVSPIRYSVRVVVRSSYQKGDVVTKNRSLLKQTFCQTNSIENPVPRSPQYVHPRSYHDLQDVSTLSEGVSDQSGFTVITVPTLWSGSGNSYGLFWFKSKGNKDYSNSQGILQMTIKSKVYETDKRLPNKSLKRKSHQS